MHRLLVPLLLGAFMSQAFAAEPKLADLVPDLKVKKLASGMKFIEGPVWTDADGGYLVFSDIPASELKKWTGTFDGKLSTDRIFTNQTNGNTRDREGRLLSCEHQARRVSRTQPDGLQLLVDNWQGKKFNSPNDIIVKSDGSIWFTDPTYGLEKRKQEIPGQYVFRFDDSTSTATPVVKDFDQPNGLCFGPDEKKLYIADSGKPHHIRVFDVSADNQLTNSKIFCIIDNGVPDGIRCDAHGNLWSSAGDGIHIFAPTGALIGKIPVPETPANLAFGGSDGKTLFITARTSLYAIKTNVPGATLPK